MDANLQHGVYGASGNAEKTMSTVDQSQLGYLQNGHEGRSTEIEARAALPFGSHETSAPPANDDTFQNGAASAQPSERDAEIGVAAGRAPAVTSKEWAGSVVWARLDKYPWWPAQVLDENDPWIPSDAESPRHGAIPVRFFGTYDFAWIESHRMICAYDKGHAEHSKQDRQQVFVQAMQEADRFEETQELPNGFNEDLPPSPQAPPAKKAKTSNRPASGKAKPRRSQAGGARAGTKRGAGDSSHPSQRNVRERQDAILRRLSLIPPADSPYVHKLNLDGIKELLRQKKLGLWPPQPKPAAPSVPAAAAQQPGPSAAVQKSYPPTVTAPPGIVAAAQATRAHSGSSAGGHQATQPASQAASQASQSAAGLSYPASLLQMSSSYPGQSQSHTSQLLQYQQLLQQPQFLQHLQNQTGQTPWYLQSQMYSPHLGYGYYPSQGVGNVLMAAASQAQMPYKPQPQRPGNDSKAADTETT